MAAIDFPNSPTTGDTFTVGDTTWEWTGTVWDGVDVANENSVPAGGSEGQVLAKNSATNYDTEWITVSVEGNLPLTGGTMTGKITLDGDPTSALHAVTKQYVDNVEAGIITRPQVRAATTANLAANYLNGTLGVGATLTSTANGAFPLIDNVAVTTVNGARGVLVKNQTSSFQNGRYNLTTQGTAGTPWVLTRCGLCDEADEIPGSYIFVTDGDINGGTGWVQNVADPSTFVVGTDAITALQFSGAGTVTAGTNVAVSGNQVSVINNPTFTGVVTTNEGITNAQAKNASIVSSFNSISGGFNNGTRVIMSAASTANTPVASGAATITIASPAVVTRATHGLANGSLVFFTTTGALPTGLLPNVNYFVINSATNTFNVSSTQGGTAINTSGTQSGTHSVARQTAPNRRPDNTPLEIGDIWFGFF
jgi:hypothetical protein